MRTVLDLVNLKPIDEKLLSQHPEFNKISQDLSATTNESQKNGRSIFAVFHRQDALEAAVQDLQFRGIEGRTMKTFTCHKGNFLDHQEALIESKIGEGTILGAFSGACLGAVIGMLNVFSFQATIGAGSLQSFFNILVSAAISGMLFGVMGAMIGRLIPEYQIEKYETSLPEGYVLLVVTEALSEKPLRVAEILKGSRGVVVSHPCHLKLLQPLA